MSLSKLNAAPPQLELAGLMTCDPETLIAHVDEEGLPADFRWPKFLAELHDRFEAVVKRYKRLTPSEQFTLVRDLILTQSLYQGGRFAYLPQGDALRVAIRDRQIWARHLHGDSMEQLMQDTGLSESGLGKVLQQQRKLFESLLQPRLALPEEGACKFAEDGKQGPPP